jgi:hypothetical protein
MRTVAFNLFARKRVHFGLGAAEGIGAAMAQRGAPCEARLAPTRWLRETHASMAGKGLAIAYVRTHPRKVERVAQPVEMLEAAW